MRNNYMDRSDSTPNQQSSGGGIRDYYNHAHNQRTIDDTKVTPWSIRGQDYGSTYDQLSQSQIMGQGLLGNNGSTGMQRQSS